MRVVNADVSFSTSHQLQRQQRVLEVERAPETARSGGAAIHGDQFSRNSSRARALQARSDSPPNPSRTSHNESLPTRGAVQPELATGFDARVLRIKYILEAYFGEKINLTAAAAVGSIGEGADDNHGNSAVSRVSEDLPSSQENTAVRWVHLSLREREQTEVGVKARVTLGTGETLDISLEQSMARRLSIDAMMTREAAHQYIDPLVINFEGPVVLNTETTDFDVNADGNAETIARFASDSAYIALDLNGDGRINDGTELFGATSGDGFADLARYDDDGNGFIDSGDAVFAKLLLFRPGDSLSGGNQLQSLHSRGVEALYLGSTSSPFQLQDANGDIAGRVRSSGFYLAQAHGTVRAGSLQQIDLVV